MLPHSIKNIFILLLGLIVIAIGISAGVYYLLADKLAPQSASETILPSPTTFSMSTTNWQDYTNNNFLFSLKYPKEELAYFAIEDESKDSLQVHGAPKNPRKIRDFPPFNIYVSVNNYKQTLDAYTNDQLKDRAYKNAKKASISIDGLPAYAITRIPDKSLEIGKQ